MDLSFEVMVAVISAIIAAFYAWKYHQVRQDNKDIARLTTLLAATNVELYKLVPEDKREGFKVVGGHNAPF